MTRDPPDSAPAALEGRVLRAAAELGSELIALTEGDGSIVWANGRFHAAFGPLAKTAGLPDLTAPGEAGTASRRAIADLLDSPSATPHAAELRGSEGPLHVEMRVAPIDGRRLWTMQDTTRLRQLEALARRQGELLDIAQEFGRLGTWEREIPSGEGRWDRHVFGFWGLDPDDGTPNFAQAIERIHPEDRARMNYIESTLRAGRYAQRYRVIHPDGRTRLIHSQWQVRNGPGGSPDRALGIMMDDTEAFEAARQLGNVNDQLEMAMALGKIAIWRHDLRTHRIHYNRSVYPLIGMPERPEGIPVDEVRSYIHPDDLGIVVASAEQALRTGEPNDFEARYRRQDGAWRYILTRRAVERGPAGEPVAFIGVALDVSERDENLRKAQELARRLDAASRASRVGLWTTSVQPPETDWNGQMFALFDAFAPPHAPSLGQWLLRGVHADDRERVASATRSFLTSGLGPFEIEFRTVGRAGTRWIVMRSDVDPEARGRRRLLGVAMDVTEHHLALEALRLASERAALIARQAGIGMWEADLDGHSARWDAQMFLLRGLAPRAGPPSRTERLAMVHPDDVAVLLDSVDDDSVAAAQAAAYEFRIRLADGSWRWLASRSAVLGDASGRPTRRVGVNWDVTESKNAQQARQQAALAEREVQAKSQFLSRMSHELRTPLNAVLGFTRLLELEAEQARRPAELAKLAHIRAAGDHLLALIDDVLELSGLEAAPLRLTLQPVALERIANEAVALLVEMAAECAVSVRVDGDGGVALADATRLRQVLINLLSNAIKYNRSGGRVVVRTHGRRGRAVLVVEDSGRGLSPAQLARLYEPFSRFGADQEAIQGTGIGLSIVKALVDGMQGRIEVRSEPGRGTTFTIAFAAAEPGTTPEAPAAPAPAPACEPRSGSVLYIEDNHVNVVLVEELVKSIGGIALSVATTGQAGVEHARAHRPELVLIDLQLPDFDGFEVLRRLRADAATAAIPCIALSANALPEDIERGLAAGFADYWTKPIDFDVFIAAMRARFAAVAPTAGERLRPAPPRAGRGP